MTNWKQATRQATTYTTTLGAKALLLAGTAAVVLTGCRDKDEVKAGADFEVPGISSDLMDSHFAVAKRSIDETAALGGLAYIGLDEKSERVTWASRTGDAGTYTYDDLVITTDEGGTIAIDDMTLTNLSETNGSVSVGMVNADDITVTPSDGGGSLSVENFMAVEPDMDSFIAMLGGDSDLPEAKALSISGVSGTMSDTDSKGTASLARFAFADAKTASSRDGFVFIDDVELDLMITEDGAAIPLKMSLDDMRVTGLADAGAFTGDMDALMELSSGSNTFTPPVDNMLIKDFSATFDTLNLDLDSLKAVYDTKGDTVTTVSKLEPFTLSFTGDPTSPELMQAKSALDDLGYDKLVLSGGGTSILDKKADTVVVKDNYFVIDDMMRMDMNFEMGGITAMQAAQAEAMAALGPKPDEDDFEAQMDYMMAQSEAGNAGLEYLSIKSADIRIGDKSILERAFKVAAESQGTTPQKLRGQAKGMLGMGTMMAAGSGVDTAIASEMVEALSGFIDTPGSTLVITLNPGSPLMIGDAMEAPDTLTKDALGFSATVED